MPSDDPASQPQPQPEPVTMEDVAKAAGASKATVSRALRNHPRISQATRDRIQKVAAELGYRPDPMVSALFHKLNAQRPKQRSSSVVIIDDWQKMRLAGKLPLYQEIVTSARERFDHAGYVCDEFDIQEWKNRPARLLQILHARNVQGLLFLHFPPDFDHLQWDLSNFACATVGTALVEPHLHRAMQHHFQCLQCALKALYQQGYRAPALVQRSTTMTFADDLWAGSYWAFAKAHPDVKEIAPHASPLDFSRDSVKTLQRWLKRARPDVLLCTSAVVLNMLEQLELRVPEDMGFANLNLGADSRPTAGVDLHTREIGHAAADLIIGQLNRNHRGIPEHPKNVLIEGTWIDGPTVRQLD